MVGCLILYFVRFWIHCRKIHIYVPPLIMNEKSQRLDLTPDIDFGISYNVRFNQDFCGLIEFEFYLLLFPT